MITGIINTIVLFVGLIWIDMSIQGTIKKVVKEAVREAIIEAKLKP